MDQGGTVQLPKAHSLLEGGGETAPALSVAMARRLEELASGQVLEVVSGTATARLDAIAWCHVSGDELLGLLAEGEVVRFWIRKRGDEGRIWRWSGPAEEEGGC